MSRLPISLPVADISAFARALRGQLGKLDRPPSHVELLNMLARAGGYRNFQHLRADGSTMPEWAGATPAAGASHDAAQVEKVLRHFDPRGRLIRWPGRNGHQRLCLWGVWSFIPAGHRFSEKEINAFIVDAHGFGDYALLRRALVDAGMLARTPEGSIYRRIERPAPPEAVAIMAEIGRRAGP